MVRGAGSGDVACERGERCGEDMSIAIWNRGKVIMDDAIRGSELSNEICQCSITLIKLMTVHQFGNAGPNERGSER